MPTKHRQCDPHRVAVWWNLGRCNVVQSSLECGSTGDGDWTLEHSASPL